MISDCDALEFYNLDKNTNSDVVESLLKRDNDFVGKINYLDFNGKVAEISYYTNYEDYISAIKEEKWYGVPITIATIKGNKREVYNELERSIF